MARKFTLPLFALILLLAGLAANIELVHAFLFAAVMALLAALLCLAGVGRRAGSAAAPQGVN